MVSHAGPVDDVETFRSGFACLVGRPNTGKSTLTNALVGDRVAITSSRPQTTRHAIRGVVHRPDSQLVLIDTPGLHRPRTLLGQRLNDVVRDTWSEVDVVAFCTPADERIGKGDQFVAESLAVLARTPVLAVVTKTDLVGSARIAEHLADVAALGDTVGLDWAEVVPVSARTGDGVDLLHRLVVNVLPEGPAYYPDGDLTDEPTEVLVAELIREAALEDLHDELPHSLAVLVDEIVPRDDRPDDRPLLDVRATLFVERSSQKPIVVGRRGARVKQIGSAARQHIERLLGTPVYLDLHVKIAKEWQRDPKQLRRLGF
jgi:GTP-binding protein Era